MSLDGNSSGREQRVEKCSENSSGSEARGFSDSHLN